MPLCSLSCSVLFSARLSSPRTVPAAAKPAATAATVAAFFATRFSLDAVIGAPRFAARPDLDFLLADFPPPDDDFARVRPPNVFSTFFRLVPARLTALFTAPLLLPLFCGLVPHLIILSTSHSFAILAPPSLRLLGHVSYAPSFSNQHPSRVRLSSPVLSIVPRELSTANPHRIVRI